ncbi:MAG: NAD(P)H-dependent oxidoreductase [Acidimicrobiia bacterium]|nr:NAD(P)H-dependent oxidoreductase [Acidimicrobiia bacterium]
MRLKEAIAAADGVLIATPKYQHGVPGVLKNALDWTPLERFGWVLAVGEAGLDRRATIRP